MEITDTLNRYNSLSKIIYSFLKVLLYCIRKICKVFALHDGNITIISLHKLGDTVFTIPAIKEIQKSYKRRITIICFPEAISIFKIALQNIEFAAIEHKYFYFNERIASTKARKILRSSKPEIIFDLTGVMISASLIFTSRANKIIGLSREQFKTIYDYNVPIKRTPHLIDRYLDVVANIIPSINLNRNEIKIFNVEDHSKNSILIHPFAGWKAKEWGLKKTIELALKLSYQYEVCIVVQKNKISEDTILEIRGKKIDLVQTGSVTELIELIKKYSIFIGCDSGPIHIASLLKKNTFSIYGPTNPLFSFLSGPRHYFINKNLICSPIENKDYCFTMAGKLGCPSHECMNKLANSEVSTKVFTNI